MDSSKKKFNIKDRVFAYIPLMCNCKINIELKILEIEEKYLFKLDEKLDSNDVVCLVSGALKAYNALFQKAKITENDNILILNPTTNSGYITY